MPGGGIPDARGVAPHGRGARAYMDVFTASPRIGDPVARPPTDPGRRYARFCSAATAASRSSRRRILPTLVFGSSSRNSMYFGFL